MLRNEFTWDELEYRIHSQENIISNAASVIREQEQTIASKNDLIEKQIGELRTLRADVKKMQDIIGTLADRRSPRVD